MKYILFIGVVLSLGVVGYYTIDISSMDTQKEKIEFITNNLNTTENINSIEELEEVVEEKLPNTKMQISTTEMNDVEKTISEQSMEDSKIEVDKIILQNDSEDMVTTNNQIPEASDNIQTRTMLVAGGCFWCVEADLEKVPGVIEVVSGYAEGTNENPTYQNYIANGHREVAEVTFDPQIVSFEEILIATIKHTDPTDDNGSFADRGNYYLTALYYENASEKKIIDELIAEIDEKGPYDKPLAIDVLERPKF